MLDVLGIDYMRYNQFQGESLIPLIKNGGNSPRMAYSGGNHGRGVIIEGDWKYYYYDLSTKTNRLKNHQRPPEDYAYTFGEELYNIKRDPKETENLIERNKDIAWDLKEKLWLLKERSMGGHTGTSIELDEQTREQLKTLGYIQ